MFRWLIGEHTFQTGIPTKVKPKPSTEEKPSPDKKPLDAENIVKPSDVIRNYKGKNKENVSGVHKVR
jgi:hypothetical protein